MGMVSLSFVTIHCGLESDLYDTLRSIEAHCGLDNYEVIVKSCSPVSIGGFHNVQLLEFGDDGIYDAMNKALDNINGTHVMFLNSGDKLMGLLDDRYLTEFVYYGRVKLEGLKKYVRAKYFPLLGIMPNHQSYIVPIKYLAQFKYPLEWETASDCYFKLFLNKTAILRQYKECLILINSPGKSGDFSDIKVVKTRAEEMSQIIGTFYGKKWGGFIKLIYLGYYNLKRFVRFV